MGQVKILSYAWVIHDDKIQKFAGNCTGGGVVIKNICEYIGRKEKSFLFIGKYKLPQMKLGNINIVASDTLDLLEDKNYSDIEAHIHNMCINFKKALDNIKPDIVNFHGIGEMTMRCIDICKQFKIPFVFTEHLYIGLNKDFDGYDTTVEWEKQLYSLPDVNIITVSTGMKNKILNDYPQISKDRIKTIINGTDFKPIFYHNEISDVLKLKSKKVFMCVGTISERKNQMQIVRVFELLPRRIKAEITVVFCGNDSMNGKLQYYINQKGLRDRLIYVGGVSSEKMKEYYTVANGLLMPSKSEGLSIASLEAIAYGLPVLMYRDSECAPDLNDENVICFAEDRSDGAVMEALIKMYNHKWDKDYIINYSKKYTMEHMADNYLEVYRNIIENKE